MERKSNKLTAIAVRNAPAKNRPYKLGDGDGLYLLIEPRGTKLWRWNYRFAAKQKTLAIGVHPDVSLGAARLARDAARGLLADGIDPSAAKRIPGDVFTFEAVARDWYSQWKIGKKKDSVSRDWRPFETNVFPAIGSKLIGEVTMADTLKVLRAIEARGALEIARRTRANMSKIFRKGIRLGAVKNDPAALVEEELKPKPRTEPQASLRPDQLPGFLAQLAAYDGYRQPAVALRLTILTWLRTSEIRFGHADELERLDGDRPLWRIAPSRMKMNREHLVPLSRAAAALIRDHVKPQPGNMLFPAPTKSGAFSENAMLDVMYNLGYKSEATVHGFRHLASTMANEWGWNGDWIERQLAHVEDNKIRGTYNAAEWLPRRRQMLEWWAGIIARAEQLGDAFGEWWEAQLEARSLENDEDAAVGEFDALLI